MEKAGDIIFSLFKENMKKSTSEELKNTKSIEELLALRSTHSKEVDQILVEALQKDLMLDYKFLSDRNTSERKKEVLMWFSDIIKNEDISSSDLLRINNFVNAVSSLEVGFYFEKSQTVGENISVDLDVYDKNRKFFKSFTLEETDISL